MKIEDKKLEIIEWLIHVQDKSVLNQIDFLRKTEEMKWSSLSNEEKEAIEQGIRELDEGKGIPHENVLNDLRKKYKP